MCGFGGSSSSSASQDALAKEQDLALKRTDAKNQNDDLARMQAIAKVNEMYGVNSTVNGKQVNESNGVFDTQSVTQRYDGADELAQRNAGYGSVRQNALDVALNDLSKQHDVANRDLKFNVARSGLTGGSVDVDKNAELAGKYSEGVLTSNSNADGIVNNIKAKDESTRADLISRINAGMDANSATSSALSQIQNNQAQGRVDGQSNLLSNFFNGIANGVGAYQYANGGNSVQQVAGTNYYTPAGFKGKSS